VEQDTSAGTAASEVTGADIVAARAAGVGVVKHTPVVESGSIGEATGGRILLKVESLQRTGSFKIRGAMNKLLSLGDAAASGVTAGSAGNHAQAIAFAARQRRLPCEIFVPSGASLSKIEACRSFGATIVEGGDSLDAAQRMQQGHVAVARQLCQLFRAEERRVAAR
jgi:threonine dehydratase